MTIKILHFPLSDPAQVVANRATAPLSPAVDGVPIACGTYSASALFDLPLSGRP